jgi:hypothetical protein
MRAARSSEREATAASLERAADATNLGPAGFTRYYPGVLTGAV